MHAFLKTTSITINNQCRTENLTALSVHTREALSYNQQPLGAHPCQQFDPISQACQLSPSIAQTKGGDADLFDFVVVVVVLGHCHANSPLDRKTTQLNPKI